MKLALSTSHFLLGAGALALAAGLGCGTRTSIGEVADAGPGGSSTGQHAASGGISGGTSGGTSGAGAAGGSSGTGGVVGPSGSGGLQASGGHTGGMTGAQGGHTGGITGTGAGGAGGGGGSVTTACQAYPPQAAGGQGGRVSGCAAVVYPASGFFGDNILADGCAQFTSYAQYDIAAAQTLDVPVQVIVTTLQDNGTGGSNGFQIGAGGDWRQKSGSDNGFVQEIFMSRPISENEANIEFFGSGTARVDIYDCDLTTPSRSKIISWAP